MARRIAYIVNQYPKVSHSFIRREISALERLGLQVERMSIRGWNDTLVDADDLQERKITRYALQGGVLSLLIAMAAMLVSHPVRFFRALMLATRMGVRSDRAMPYHWVYFGEACVVARWLAELRVDHLHAHFGTNSAEVAMLAGLLADKPYSFTAHGPEEFDRPQFAGLGEKIRRAAFVVAISSYGRSQLFRWVDHSQWSKVHVVHCGLDAAFHRDASSACEPAARLVCVGRICEQKGQLLLVAAMRKVLDRGVAFELVLAGDGEMRGDVESLVKELGLERQVRITGWISGDQVRAEILRSRALVLASFAEGLPVVIMEAMALRRPVLSTYVAGIPELVLQGEAGWLFPAGDVDELADAIVRCLQVPAGQLEAMGNVARARALERHDIDTEAAKLHRLFAPALQHG
ncbi:MAG: glycosyltransferase family 4 protein [Rhizobacter sp.]|nr:glycosyltransferase family 4 protein [Rhizobacter sp.]